MTKFNELFQTKVNVGAIVTLNAQQMSDAVENTSTAQIEVNPARVKTIATSIVKDGQLWIHPTIAMIDGQPEQYNIDGRHRDGAASLICEDYVINAKGQVKPFYNSKGVAQFGDGDDYESIEYAIDCRLITVPDKVALNALIIAFNGSRSASAYEKLLSREDAGISTPAEDAKMSLTRALYNGFAEIDVTRLTCNDMATSILSKAGTNSKYATEEQLQEIADYVTDAANESPERVPANVARNYKEWLLPLLFENVTTLDDDGDEVETTYIDSWASKLEKPVKQKKGSKTEQLAAQLAALQAKLQELGVDPSAV